MGGAAPSGGFLILFAVLPVVTGTVFALAFNREGKGGALSVFRGLGLFIAGFLLGAAAPLLFIGNR